MEGLLYVVYNEWIINPKTGKKPYKIGITKKTVDERYYGLGLKMPGTFKTLFAYQFDDCDEAEVTIQRLYKKYRVNGEWFEIDDDQIELLKKNCENMGGIPVTEEIENEVKNETEYDETDVTQEIKKIERRINGWFLNREQTNSKILYAFIKLYKQNNGIVTYEELEKEAAIKKFKGNFDQMKNFGEKNHGKIFEQTGNNIKLWEEVENIIWERAKKYGV
jgi:thiol-disulfide isomerase/thioredoxin